MDSLNAYNVFLTKKISQKFSDFKRDWQEIIQTLKHKKKVAIFIRIIK